MFTVPTLIPITTPVVAPTVAIAGLLLLHVPPGVGCVHVVLDPTHTFVAPVTAPVSVAFTVICVVAIHPAGST